MTGSMVLSLSLEGSSIHPGVGDRTLAQMARAITVAGLCRNRTGLRDRRGVAYEVVGRL